MAEIIVISSNVRSFPVMPLPRATADFKASLHVADVVLWQEITPKNYRDSLAEACIAEGHKLYLPPGGNPISYRNDVFDAISSGHDLILPGEAKKWPDRYFTWALVRHRKTNEKIVFTNAHYPAGAFNLLKPDRLYRLKKWREFRKKHAAKLIELRDKYRCTTVIGADINAKRDWLGDNWSYLPGLSRSIDKLAIRKRYTSFIWSGKAKKLKRYSDHKAILGIMTDEKPKKEPKLHPRDRLIKTAKSQVGYREGKRGGRWANIQKYSLDIASLLWSQGQPWCAVFVSWCAIKSGNGLLLPITASCDQGAAWFKRRGQWGEIPKLGAQVFYGSKSDLNHTGLVMDFDETYIYTVEGNTNADGGREGYGVLAKKRRRRDANVVGYGYPRWHRG